MAKRVFKLNDVLNFGKFKGQTLAEVLKTNPDYLRWCKENIDWFDYDSTGTQTSPDIKPTTKKYPLKDKDKKYQPKETRLDTDSPPPGYGGDVLPL